MTTEQYNAKLAELTAEVAKLGGEITEIETQLNSIKGKRGTATQERRRLTDLLKTKNKLVDTLNEELVALEKPEVPAPEAPAAKAPPKKKSKAAKADAVVAPATVVETTAVVATDADVQMSEPVVARKVRTPPTEYTLTRQVDDASQSVPIETGLFNLLTGTHAFTDYVSDETEVSMVNLGAIMAFLVLRRNSRTIQTALNAGVPAEKMLPTLNELAKKVSKFDLSKVNGSKYVDYPKKECPYIVYDDLKSGVATTLKAYNDYLYRVQPRVWAINFPAGDYMNEDNLWVKVDALLDNCLKCASKTKETSWSSFSIFPPAEIEPTMHLVHLARDLDITLSAMPHHSAKMSVMATYKTSMDADGKWEDLWSIIPGCTLEKEAKAKKPTEPKKRPASEPAAPKEPKQAKKAEPKKEEPQGTTKAFLRGLAGFKTELHPKLYVEDKVEFPYGPMPVSVNSFSDPKLLQLMPLPVFDYTEEAGKILALADYIEKTDPMDRAQFDALVTSICGFEDTPEQNLEYAFQSVKKYRKNVLSFLRWFLTSAEKAEVKSSPVTPRNALLAFCTEQIVNKFVLGCSNIDGDSTLCRSLLVDSPFIFTVLIRTLMVTPAEPFASQLEYAFYLFGQNVGFHRADMAKREAHLKSIPEHRGNVYFGRVKEAYEALLQDGLVFAPPLAAV